MPYTVFVSYTWSNSGERLALASEIGKLHDVKVLVDREHIHPGESIHSRVSDMIDAADCVVVLLTPEALTSKEVLDELSRSHERHKLIVPVVSTAIETVSLPWYLREIIHVPYDSRNFDAMAECVAQAIMNAARRAEDLADGELEEQRFSFLGRWKGRWRNHKDGSEGEEMIEVLKQEGRQLSGTFFDLSDPSITFTFVGTYKMSYLRLRYKAPQGQRIMEDGSCFLRLQSTGDFCGYYANFDGSGTFKLLQIR